VVASLVSRLGCSKVAQFELGARVEWQAMRRHPWLARVMHISRPAPLPHALAFVDWLMRALDATALDEAGKLQLHVVVHSFIQGLAVNVEAEAQAVAVKSREVRCAAAVREGAPNRSRSRFVVRVQSNSRSLNRSAAR
jgi:hypothetical protein